MTRATLTLVQRVELARALEARRVIYFDRSGWAVCPGCNQSCTGVYLRRQCCARCHQAVT